MSSPLRAKRPPRIRQVPTARVLLEAPGHRADWPRRAQVVPDLVARVDYVRRTGRWSGAPLRVRRQGASFALVAGFSRLAVAVEAGLEMVPAIVDPPAHLLPLAQIHLRPWQEQATLNPEKLARRRAQVRQSGALMVALVVRPAGGAEPPGYTLLDGLYWYRVAQELGLELVPVQLQEGSSVAEEVRGET